MDLTVAKDYQRPIRALSDPVKQRKGLLHPQPRVIESERRSVWPWGHESAGLGRARGLGHPGFPEARKGERDDPRERYPV
jgi:hypothetical protein